MLLHPFVPDISQHSEKLIPSKKEEKNTIEEEFEEGELKNRARNRRSSWCIIFFTLFS
jgi:hypothetical protein